MRFLDFFEQCKNYIVLPTPVEGDKYQIVGYFPYSTASISNKCVKIPRAVMATMERLAQENNCMDNKVVLICRDTERFGTDNFAVQFHDSGCRIGYLEDVVGYGGREL